MPNEQFEKDPKEGWEEKVSELQDLMMKVVVETKVGMHHPVYQNFFRDMKEKYSRDELIRSRLWHLIIGSTPVHEEIEVFDLPEGEVEKFIREDLPHLKA